MNDVFCINCRHSWGVVCENPKGRRTIKTPYKIEICFAFTSEQNRNNNCPWFEEKRSYKQKGFFATILWNAYKFFRNKDTKPPIWYGEDEIRTWLEKNRFWLRGTSEQVAFIAKHLQLAFEKGYQIRGKEKP